MTWFAGTSTGNRYTVGQSYSMAGRTYTAQADGSFRRDDGHSVVGSSTSAVQWGGTSSGSDRDSRGTGAGVAQVSTGKSAASSTGPGNPGVSSGVAGSGPGAGDMVLPEGKLHGTTPLYYGGSRLSWDPGTSDAQDFEQRYGEGDIGNPTFFYQWGVWGADYLSDKPVLKTVLDVLTPDRSPWAALRDAGEAWVKEFQDLTKLPNDRQSVWNRSLGVSGAPGGSWPPSR